MKNFQLRTFSYLAFFSIILTAVSCKKTSTTTTTVVVPSVTTTGAIIDLTSTTAQSGGTVTSAGNGVISTNGVCYSSTNTTPTTADTKTKDDVSDAGTSATTFMSNLTGLTPNTKYYLRAYATNTAGVGYGAVITFTTPSDAATIVGVVTTFAGNGSSGYADGSGTGAMFNNPAGIAIDKSNNLFISDTYNNMIRGVSSGAAVTTIAGNGVNGLIDAVGTAAEFYSPQGVVADASGNLYVADQGNNVIRKIATDGTVSTFAGMAGIPGYRNGEANVSYLKNSADSLCLFRSPQGLAMDASGNLFVADRGNQVIRKITPAGRVTTIAGAGTHGYYNATDEAAYFYNPTSLCVDASGNVYVTDSGNSAIRKITTGGVVTTIAGGPNQTGLLNSPVGITMDSAGNFYIVDAGGRVLKYTTDNILYVLAGTVNVSGFVNATGAAAQFNNPQGIVIDSSGALYVTDQGNNAIRKVVIQTVTN